MTPALTILASARMMDNSRSIFQQFAPDMKRVERVCRRNPACNPGPGYLENITAFFTDLFI